MYTKTLFLALIFAFVAYSCNDSNTKGEVTEVNETDELALSEGFQLLENNCFSCHSPNASIDNRIAPPMFAVKKHYMEEGMTQEEFTADIRTFLNHPSEEISKMPGAVKRFNLMPKMSFTDDQITKIAAYIFQSELEKPDWFDKHYEQERTKHMGETKELTPLELGQKIAMQTKSVLGKNLLQAINTRGTEGAVDFCSTKAIHLTDSMAVSLNAKVKRVSDKNRNPDNAANAAELAYIKSTKMAIAKGEKPKPKMTEMGNKSVGYYPILSNKMCLQCHGAPKTEITPSTLAKINSIYPKDLAFGYGVDELRGIWVVEMEK